MKTNQEIAKEVIAGNWGNNEARRTALTEAGYDYDSVQSIVNALLSNPSIADSTKADREGTVPDTETELAMKILEVDYDPEIYGGIQINIIVG